MSSAFGADRLDDLLRRMQAGDREAVVEFIDRYGSRIRRRMRDKLGVSMRRVFDSQDLLSTLSRRMDEMVTTGRIRAANDSQLWSLVMSVASHAISENARLVSKLKTIDSPTALDDNPVSDEKFLELVAGDIDARVELQDVFERLQDDVDRHILWMWLMEAPHKRIAAELDMTPSSVRMRWHRITSRLRSSLPYVGEEEF